MRASAQPSDYPQPPRLRGRRKGGRECRLPWAAEPPTAPRRNPQGHRSWPGRGHWWHVHQRRQSGSSKRPCIHTQGASQSCTSRIWPTDTAASRCQMFWHAPGSTPGSAPTHRRSGAGNGFSRRSTGGSTRRRPDQGRHHRGLQAMRRGPRSRLRPQIWCPEVVHRGLHTPWLASCLILLTALMIR